MIEKGGLTAKIGNTKKGRKQSHIKGKKKSCRLSHGMGRINRDINQPSPNLVGNNVAPVGEETYQVRGKQDLNREARTEILSVKLLLGKGDKRGKKQKPR